MSPTDRVAQLYPQAPGFLFITFYDSQGYGGGIRTRLHTGEYYELYDQVKEDEMGGHVARMGRRGKHIGYWWDSQKERATRKTKTLVGGQY
jgi:hypothetical protein